MSKSNELSIPVSIVEDDTSVRKMLTEWIRRSNEFQCVSDYASGEEALQHLPAVKPRVVLMDINLPSMSGIECVRRLKPLLPETQFLMLTVYEDDDHIFDALAAGACGYLLKRTPRQELLTALKGICEGGSPMTSNIARRVVASFQEPSSPAQPPSDNDLSPRQREVVELLARGYLYKEIAERMGLSVVTVNTYIRRIYEKLHVRSRGQAVAKFMNFPEPGLNPKA